MSIHVAWRLEAAGQVARAYGGNRKLAAVMVAGSVGSGLADQFSDLELDCYWFDAPDERDRTAPVQALGTELTALWDYDEDDEEWSEDYHLGQLDVTVSNFRTATIERFLHEVVDQSDTDPVKHMRLAAVLQARPLLGAELIASWQARAGCYPDKLAAAMVEQALDPAVLAGWAARYAMAARGDDLALGGLLMRSGDAAVRAVLAVNHVYLPHRQLKWQQHLIAGLRLAPQHFALRLQRLTAPPAIEPVRVAEALLADTVELAEAHTTADIASFRAALSERRRALGPHSSAEARKTEVVIQPR